MNTIIKELGKVCVTPKGEWDINKSYENVDLVYNVETGKSYISKKDVPAGTDIDDTEYWMLFSETKVGGTAIIDEASDSSHGVVKLGKSKTDGWFPIGNIPSSKGSGLGLQIDSSVFAIFNAGDDNALGLKINNETGLKKETDGLRINLGTSLRKPNHNAIPLCVGTPINIDNFSTFTGGKNAGEVPLIPVNPNQFKLGGSGLELINADSSVTKVTWDDSSNMNDFKTPGVYEIYGERTRQDDNLPILNASSGHSISARLTVIASTLQPANDEICITQFLMLSNRLGGEGNMYVRTHNENNSPTANGWTPWQKQMGIVETVINSDYATVGQEVFASTAKKIGNGLNSMIDNGMYSGVYTDALKPTGVDNAYWLNTTNVTYLETFVLVVINDYAISGKVGQPRRITQLKYAIDAITGQNTIKKRVGTGSEDISWSDWQDISGGGSSEVDVTDAVKAYGLPTLILQGLAKEGVTYKVTCETSSVPMMDTGNTIAAHISSISANTDDPVIFKISIMGYSEYFTAYIDCYIHGGTGKYYKYVISNFFNPDETVRVSADMTEL